MHEAHGEVDAGAHVVSGEAAHEGVEFGGCRADAEEKGDGRAKGDKSGDRHGFNWRKMARGIFEKYEDY